MADIEKDKALLVEQAAELYLLGLEIDLELQQLEEAKKAGGRLEDNPNVVGACARLKKHVEKWKAMEAEHLQLREKLGLGE